MSTAFRVYFDLQVVSFSVCVGPIFLIFPPNYSFTVFPPGYGLCLANIDPLLHSAFSPLLFFFLFLHIPPSYLCFSFPWCYHPLRPTLPDLGDTVGDRIGPTDATRLSLECIFCDLGIYNMNIVLSRLHQ